MSGLFCPNCVLGKIELLSEKLYCCQQCQEFLIELDGKLENYEIRPEKKPFIVVAGN